MKDLLLPLGAIVITILLVLWFASDGPKTEKLKEEVQKELKQKKFKPCDGKVIRTKSGEYCLRN